MYNILQQPKSKIITNSLIQPPVETQAPKPSTAPNQIVLQHIADGLFGIFDTFLGPMNYYKAGLLFITLALLIEFTR